MQRQGTVFDVELVEWQQAGLLRSSVFRLHKVNTVEKRLVDGIELLNANQQLGGDPQGKLIVVNEALGESAEIKLAL